MTHGLQFGSLDLVDGYSDEGYNLHVLADGMSMGSPEAKVKQIVTALADGDLASYDRAGNRVVTFDVEITAPDGLALAQGEAALRREMFRPNTITWTPPSDFAPPTVYDVLTSEGSHTFNDLDELRTRRTFKLTLTCAPYGRSVDLVTAEPLPVPVAVPTTITVNDADTTTGWSATLSTYSGGGPSAPAPLTVTDMGAYVQAQGSGTWPSVVLKLAFSAIDMTATPYLQVEMSGDVPKSFRLIFGGTIATVAPSLTRATTSGTTLYLFDVPSLLLGSLTGFWALNDKVGTTGTVTLNVHDVTRTDTLPQVTGHQVSRVIPISGTERTTGSVHVSAPNGTSDLGVAIVHTSPDDGWGYSPPLRRWRTSGNTVTTDASLLSGQREPLTPDAFIARLPTSATPEDVYEIGAFIRCSAVATETIFWTVRTYAPDGSIHSETENSRSHEFTVANRWDYISLGILTLPLGAHAAGETQIAIQQYTLSPNVLDLDEAWYFRVGNESALTVLGSAKAHLWLDSPNVSEPEPQVRTGDEADRTDAHHPSADLVASGNHTLLPERMAVFVASSGVDYPDVTIEHHARWHTHAAE